MSEPRWISVVVVIGSILFILGGIIALVNPGMLAGKGEEINGATRVYAGYVVSRDLAIGGMLLGSLILRARGALNGLILLTAAIQFIDAGIDCYEGRWTVVPGVLVLGILFLFTGLRQRRGGN
jgi:hypothetical protein